MRPRRAVLLLVLLTALPRLAALLHERERIVLFNVDKSDIFARQSAYVSNVWVEPAHRRKGIAAALTRMTIDWARSKGCEVVRLRSSQMGRPVYASLGFEPSDEMELRMEEPEHP